MDSNPVDVGSYSDSEGGGVPCTTPTYPPPPTQHAQEYDRTGSAVVTTTTIDWEKVVEHEPHTVVQWFLYLHHNAHSEAFPFIYELGEGLIVDECGDGGRRRRMWSEFARQKLPRLLMETLSDPNMFSG